MIGKHDECEYIYYTQARDSRIYIWKDDNSHAGLIFECPDEIKTFMDQIKDSPFKAKLLQLLPSFEEKYSEWKKWEVAMLWKFATLERSKNIENW